ncbi:hypothetical protein NS506_04359 [Nocardia seriolae]|uniref:Uncharacterized protein n=1 Tax=Nocardia seriolae TaxID=37332 RepID=A0ABC8AWC5_9NOCA|nr:hypothetical protein NS506_04359 [Nocardia seriolae]
MDHGGCQPIRVFAAKRDREVTEGATDWHG